MRIHLRRCPAAASASTPARRVSHAAAPSGPPRAAVGRGSQRRGAQADPSAVREGEQSRALRHLAKDKAPPAGIRCGGLAIAGRDAGLLCAIDISLCRKQPACQGVSLAARTRREGPGLSAPPGRVQGCQLRQRTRPWGSQFGSSQVAVRLTRRCHPRARRAASAVGMGVFQPAPLPRTRPVVAEASLKSSPTERAGYVPRRPFIVTAARGGGGAAPPTVAKK